MEVGSLSLMWALLVTADIHLSYKNSPHMVLYSGSCTPTSQVSAIFRSKVAPGWELEIVL